MYKRARSVAQVWLELGHVLVQDVPELLQRGAVQVALVAVQLEHVHIPHLHVRVERHVGPREVESFDCKGEKIMEIMNLFTKRAINQYFSHKPRSLVKPKVRPTLVTVC